MIEHSVIRLVIRLAIPAATNAEQWQQIQRAIEYANARDVKVIVTEIVS